MAERHDLSLSHDRRRRSIWVGQTDTDKSPNGEHASSADAEIEPYVPVSAEGEAIKAYVGQPRHLRKPVVYRTEFLEKYHPNHTAYLPLKLREQLHTLRTKASLTSLWAKSKPARSL